MDMDIDQRELLRKMKDIEKISNKKFYINNEFEVDVFREYFYELNSKVIEIKVEESDIERIKEGEVFYIVPYGVLEYFTHKHNYNDYYISYYYTIGLSLFDENYIEKTNLNDSKYTPLYLLNRTIDIGKIPRSLFNKKAKQKLNKLLEQYETSVEFTDDMAPDDYGMACARSKSEAKKKLYKDYELDDNSYSAGLIDDGVICFENYKRNLIKNSKIIER